MDMDWLGDIESRYCHFRDALRSEHNRLPGFFEAREIQCIYDDEVMFEAILLCSSREEALLISRDLRRCGGHQIHMRNEPQKGFVIEARFPHHSLRPRILRSWITRISEIAFIDGGIFESWSLALPSHPERRIP